MTLSLVLREKKASGLKWYIAPMHTKSDLEYAPEKSLSPAWMRFTFVTPSFGSSEEQRCPWSY